jgi:REP element-mobilizing transposase RayT
MHVTLKLCERLPSLRAKEPFRLFTEALVNARAKGLRVIHYSIQSNHVHLVLEADDHAMLTRALQSLCIRFAKKLNHALKRSGPVFFGRFHLHVLKTALEVRNAIRYVLLNDDKHTKILRERRDNFSSGTVLDGKPLAIPQSICTEPRSWLLRVGWLKVAWTRLG